MNNYYAVIFRSRRSTEEQKMKGYTETADKILRLAKKQNGFIDVVTSQINQDEYITISYWQDLDAINNWKYNVQHRIAKEQGRSKWYNYYKVEVCEIKRSYENHRANNE